MRPCSFLESLSEADFGSAQELADKSTKNEAPVILCFSLIMHSFTAKFSPSLHLELH